jgi:acyl-CoA thioesterase
VSLSPGEGRPARASLGPVADELDAIFRASPFLDMLGATLAGWGPGWASVSTVVAAFHTNVVGTAHGGLSAGLADLAFEVACNSYGRVCVAASLSGHYVAPAPVGVTLLAACTEQSRRRRLGSYRIDVTDGSGTLVAWFMALAHRTDRWHLGEDRYSDEWRVAY